MEKGNAIYQLFELCSPNIDSGTVYQRGQTTVNLGTLYSSTKKRVYIMMGKVIVCYCIESEGTDPGRSEVSTGETNDISR